MMTTDDKVRVIGAVLQHALESPALAALGLAGATIRGDFQIVMPGSVEAVNGTIGHAQEPGAGEHDERGSK